MNDQKIMLCPFRKDATRDFAPCYGQDCMAYYEYDMFPNPGIMEPVQRVPVCRMMALSAPYSGGCA